MAETDQSWIRVLLLVSPFLIAIVAFVGYSLYTHDAEATDTQQVQDVELWALRINAGGERYVDSQGSVWEADQGFSSGLNWTSPEPILNTNDSILFQTERWGNDWFTGIPYSFTVPTGAYKVKLHFAEIWEGALLPGDRVFDIYIQGKSVLRNFDIVDEVPPRTPLVKTFYTGVTNGSLSLLFKHGVSQNPKISAIELIKYAEEFEAEERYESIAYFEHSTVLVESSWLQQHPANMTNATDITSWFIANVPQGTRVYDPGNVLNWSALESTDASSAQRFVDMPYWFQGDHEFYLKASGSLGVRVTKRDINRIEGKDRLAVVLSDIQGNEFDQKIIGDDNNPGINGDYLLQEQDVLFTNLATRLYKISFVGLEGSDFTYDIAVNTTRMIVANHVFTKQPHTLQFTCVLVCNVTLTPFPATPSQYVLIDGAPYYVEPRSEAYFVLLEEGNHSLRAPQGNVLVSGFGVGSLNEAPIFTPFLFVRSDHEATFVVRAAP